MTEDFWHHPMNRRSLLKGAGGLAIGSLLGGCSPQAAATLQLLLLRGSIPAQFTGEFQRIANQQATNKVNLRVDSQPQLQGLFAQLQRWQQSPPTPTPDSGWDAVRQWIPFLGGAKNRVPELMTLGDFWLGTAIAQNLVKPLAPRALQGWATLAQLPQFKQLVTRNNQGQLDAKGEIWAMPYRVGTTVLAYRKDIFQQRNLQPPTDWGDLWRTDLRRRIGLLDNPREVIGLTLKKLNQSYNTTDLASLPNLPAELQALNQQAKYYSSRTYLQPLLLDDVWLTVAWSMDVLPLSQRSQQIGVVVPASGTALSADLWVFPSMGLASLPPSAHQWIDFCWQRDYAMQLSLATWGVSPTLIGTPVEQLPQGFRDHPALLPDAAIFQKSEFLLPISKATTQQYEQLWQQMRTG
ncbi:MAG: substrate-binding domain-containing protein [Leptolyngbyaceae cyanobacterium bins.349]|nr:substrate-binding domain-containing protein [Leptolyngbyaceae cyanobacterium bins.349]